MPSPPQASAPHDARAATPSWTKSELAANPHANEQKPDKVRRMFAAIAGAYDLNNRLHSFGRDQAWRRRAVKLSRLTPRDEVLDVACGTGDLSRAFADGGAARVVGLDFTPQMLDIARGKRLYSRKRPKRPVLSYIDGDAMRLPFENASFDVVSIAFGIRNVSDPAAALAEFRRVLRPGGRVVVLEFGTPKLPPIRWANRLYTSVIMPRTATLISGDRSGAYHYLPRSVETFMTQPQMRDALLRAGFSSIDITSMTLGVCDCFVGRVPR